MSQFKSTNNPGLGSVAGAVTGLLGAFTLLSTAPLAAAQTPVVPDFTGNGEVAWHFPGDEFLSPPSGPGPVTNDKRYPYINNRVARQTRTQSTYRVADLTNPILQPWAIEQMRKANEEVIAGKVPFRPRERCYPAGVPGFLVYTLAEPLYFIQTPKQVTIIDVGGPEMRRIYLDVPHSANVTPSWYGELVGRYEGDTLVVDTIGISPKTFVDNYRTPHTDKMHVVERFRLTDGGKWLEVLLTVDDPGAFTSTWSAIQRFDRIQPGRLPEHACAENNANYFNFDVVPLPQTDKPDF